MECLRCGWDEGSGESRGCGSGCGVQRLGCLRCGEIEGPGGRGSRCHSIDLLPKLWHCESENNQNSFLPRQVYLVLGIIESIGPLGGGL